MLFFVNLLTENVRDTVPLLIVFFGNASTDLNLVK